MSALWGFVLNKQSRRIYRDRQKAGDSEINMRFHDESLVLKPFDNRQLASNRDSRFCDLKTLTKPLVRG